MLSSRTLDALALCIGCYGRDTRGDAVLIYEAGPQQEQFGRVALSGSPYGIAIDLRRDQLWVTLTTATSTSLEFRGTAPTWKPAPAIDQKRYLRL